MRALVVTLAALGIASGLAACKKSADPVVARLEEMTAQVERMPRAQSPWQPAKVGQTFVIGSAVRTGAASRARLKIGTKGKLDVDASSVVYFTRTPGQERDDLRIEAGAVELETGDVAIGIGEAVLDPNTQAHVETTAQGTTLVVTAGRAVLEDNVIAAGERVMIGRAGHRVDVNAAATIDAGAVSPKDGQIAVAVRDKPARVKTKDGERELPVGEHALEVGATLIVPAGSTLEVARNGGRAVTSGPSELRIGDGTTLVEIERGDVTLHGEAGTAVAAMRGGTVTASAGSAAGISVDTNETAIDAQRGEIVVGGVKGTQTLAAGQSATLTRGGEIKLLPPAPARTVATLTAGESATIHDAKAPTPLRVAFDSACPGAGVVELAKDRAFKKLVARSGGDHAANVLVPAGSFHYRLRCPGGAGASGTVRVAKESGRTPLPKAAARTTVEMDGREYTILYQNLLPELQLVWRTAPRGRPRYTFVIKPARGAEKRLVGTSSTLQLMAGELREGSYRVWVEPEGGARSEESRIVIQFDNAAQSASIDSVGIAGRTIQVRGTVIDNSTVTAGGTAVPVDRTRRFSTEITPGADEDGASIRIAHPKAGIHYYVMRTGAP